MGDPLGAAPGAALDAEAGGGRRDLKQVSDGGGCRKRRNARLRLGPGDMAEQPCSRRGVVGPGIGDVRNGGEADEAIFDRERDIVGQMKSVELDESPRAGELRLGRSEERRVGKECASTCRSRWAQCL